MRKCHVFAAMAGLGLPLSASAALIPVPVTGYNQDVVVEVGAPQGADLTGSITATMDAGTAETGGTWYQVGYNPGAPTTGLPSGVLTTSLTGNGDFQLPLATGNNALLLNSQALSGTLTLVNPLIYNQLAIFESAGNGGANINYTINFVGGATEAGSFASGDWFGGTPIAYNANGRVNNVLTGALDAVNSGNPRVYERVLAVSNTGSPVQSISFTRADVGGHTAILAISGSVVPEPGALGLLALGGLGLLRRRRRNS